MKITPDPTPEDMQPDLEQHTIGRRGDHLFSVVHESETGMRLEYNNRGIWIGDEDLPDLYALLTMNEDHREVLRIILEERAVKVGADLED